MEEELQPAPHIYINNLESLRVVSDSFRMQLLSLMGEPCTVKDLAKSLDIPPHKLYYHINMLEEHGFIRVTSTRMVSAILEKFYQITAYQFRTNPELLAIKNPDKGLEGLDFYLQSILDSTKNDVKKSAEAGLLDFSPDAPRLRRLLAIRGILRYSPAKAEAFYARLEEILKELSADAESTEDSAAYEFTALFFPTVTEIATSQELKKDE